MISENNFNWLREPQVQALLGLKRTTLYKMRRDNLIRWSAIGGSIFYDLKSINEFLEKNASQFSSLKKLVA